MLVFSGENQKTSTASPLPPFLERKGGGRGRTSILLHCQVKMPLKSQSHWRLINTWLKARLGQVSGLALPQCFEGLHTLAHVVSLNKSSQIIGPVDNYVNRQAVDQREPEIILYVCVCVIVCDGKASTHAGLKQSKKQTRARGKMC